MVIRTGIIALGSLLGVSACAEEAEIYCGSLLWPTEPAAYLPFPEGMRLSWSGEPSVAQVLRAPGDCTVSFSYEDMASSYRLLSDSVAMIINRGENQVCIRAALLQDCSAPTPTVSPIVPAGGPSVFECPTCRPGVIWDRPGGIPTSSNKRPAG